MCIDSYGESDSGSVTVLSQMPNPAPVADAGDDSTYTITHDGLIGGEYEFELDASASFDENNDALSYEWYLDETV